MNNKPNLLITGITGYLGRHIAFFGKDKYNIIGIANSEHKISKFKKMFPNISLFIIKIENLSDSFLLDGIIKKYSIDYIIHCAAIKHIDIAENNPTKAIDVNIIGSRHLIEIAKINNIKNIIAISTDKANNAVSTYGMTKNLMEKMFLEHNYSIFRGVNFLGSDGSVLDIWNTQYLNGEKLTISDFNQTRYYISIDSTICNYIFDNLNNHSCILYSKRISEISLQKLFEVFCKLNKIDSIEMQILGTRTNEKLIEDLGNLDYEIYKPLDEDICNMINIALSDKLFKNKFY